MIIPNNSLTPLHEIQKQVGGASKYEGKDLGGSFYRRLRKKQEEEPKEKKEPTRSDCRIDLVA